MVFLFYEFKQYALVRVHLLPQAQCSGKDLPGLNADSNLQELTDSSNPYYANKITDYSLLFISMNRPRDLSTIEFMIIMNT